MKPLKVIIDTTSFEVVLMKEVKEGFEYRRFCIFERYKIVYIEGKPSAIELYEGEFVSVYVINYLTDTKIYATYIFRFGCQDVIKYKVVNDKVYTIVEDDPMFQLWDDLGQMVMSCSKKFFKNITIEWRGCDPVIVMETLYGEIFFRDIRGFLLGVDFE